MRRFASFIFFGRNFGEIIVFVISFRFFRRFKEKGRWRVFCIRGVRVRFKLEADRSIVRYRCDLA